MIERIRTLERTQSKMCSSDYKERFVAEYNQLLIRYEKLKVFNERLELAKEHGYPEPLHDCPLKILKEQENIMLQYLRVLEKRHIIENELGGNK